MNSLTCGMPCAATQLVSTGAHERRDKTGTIIFVFKWFLKLFYLTHYGKGITHERSIRQLIRKIALGYYSV